MISNRDMIEVFGSNNLVYARSDKLWNINLANSTKEFILKTGFPSLVYVFRFSMDFEPISEDIQIGYFLKEMNSVFTIGCQSATLLIGRMFHLSEIELNKNASLSDIGKKIKSLGVDDYFLFDTEVVLSDRICIDTKNNEQIISINPKNLSISFFSSSIQHLAASLIAYEKILSVDKPFIESVSSFQKELQKIDYKALESKDNLWSQVIECLIEDHEGY